MISYVLYLFMFAATVTIFSKISNGDTKETKNSKNNDFNYDFDLEFIDLEAGVIHSM